MQLRTLAATFLILTAAGSAHADIGPAEKPDLKLGFIKLTDMAPLAIAWEQGFSWMKACSWNSKPRPTGKSCSTAW